MSEAELLSLYSDNLQGLFAVLGVLISLVFAYVVANYLAVHKLSWIQFGFLTLLYFLISMDTARLVSLQSSILGSYRSEIVTRIDQEGSNITFLNVDGLTEGSRLFPMVFWTFVIVTSIGFSIKLKYDRRNGDDA